MNERFSSTRPLLLRLFAASLGLAACGDENHETLAEGEPSFKAGTVRIDNRTGYHGAMSNFWGLYSTPRVAEEIIGPCRLTDAGDAEEASRGPGSTYSAGPIVVEGAAVPIALGEPVDGVAVVTLQSAPYVGGEMLTVRAAGGEVPAFEGTLRAPTAVQLSEPKPQADGAFAMTPTADQTFRWSGGTAGTAVVIAFESNDAGSPGLDATCTFDAAAGAGVVPGAVLAKLAALDKAVALSLSVVGESEVPAGDFKVTLTARTALAPSRGPRAGVATFE